ncbi:FHA domain-containing protein [Vulcanococcus sp.]|uniref:FHA domain-containing protein n=1 Tax=Vulcanococcus sp. TaxID=2856995 RepID=UPI0037D9DACF
MSPPSARLVLASDRRKTAPLDPAQPLTIGRASGNRLCLASLSPVSDHHAVVRFSRSQGWLVCDWQSRDGTFLEGQRVQHCRRLEDGDEIRLGPDGPVLLFELQVSAAAAVPAAAAPAPAPVRPPTSVEVDGQTVPVAMVRSAAVQSLPQHPHIFSWWLLLCLGGLLLLPFPVLFWPLQVVALGGWILLGSRKQHRLVLVLRDGRALRHSFANRRTALAHRNGIRKAIGQGEDAP